MRRRIGSIKDRGCHYRLAEKNTAQLLGQIRSDAELLKALATDFKAEQTELSHTMPSGPQRSDAKPPYMEVERLATRGKVTERHKGPRDHSRCVLTHLLEEDFEGRSPKHGQSCRSFKHHGGYETAPTATIIGVPPAGTSLAQPASDLCQINSSLFALHPPATASSKTRICWQRPSAHRSTPHIANDND